MSVVIPAYNEEDRLPNTLDKLSLWMNDSKLPTIDLIIVDDGSMDQTNKIAKRFYHHKINTTILKTDHVGYMHAIIAGVQATKAEFVGVLEADAPVEPVVFEDFLALTPNYDIVMGSRLFRGAHSIKGKTYLRSVMSWSMSKIFLTLFRCEVRDPQIGFKLYKTSCIKKILPQLTSKHDGMKCAEIIVRSYADGYKIKELPVEYYHDNDSKCVPKGKELNVAINALIGLLKLWGTICRESAKKSTRVPSVRGLAIGSILFK